MKKTTILFTLGALLLVGCATIDASSNRGNKDNIASEKDNTKLMAMDFVQSLALAPQNKKVNLLSKARENDFKENITNLSSNEINSILTQADVLLSNDNNLLITKQVSNLDVYAYQVDVSYVDIDNQKTELSLYYNEYKEKIEVDEDEEEKKLEFKGIAIIAKEEYQFKFEQEEEKEVDEQELSSKFTLINDVNSFIEIENSYEKENDESEIEYKYKVVNNNETTLKYSLKYEVENNKEQIEVKYNGVKYKIHIENINSHAIYFVKVKGVEKNIFIFERVVQDEKVSFVEIDEETLNSYRN